MSLQANTLSLATLERVTGGVTSTELYKHCDTNYQKDTSGHRGCMEMMNYLASGGARGLMDSNRYSD